MEERRDGGKGGMEGWSNGGIGDGGKKGWRDRGTEGQKGGGKLRISLLDLIFQRASQFHGKGMGSV